MPSEPLAEEVWPAGPKPDALEGGAAAAADVGGGTGAAELARRIGISRTTITNLEADDARPTLWVLLKIADGLGVDLRELL